MKPSQFFLSPVNLGGLVIFILLEVVMTMGCVGQSSLAFRGVPSGVMISVLPPAAGFTRIVPIHPVLVSIGFTSSPW